MRVEESPEFQKALNEVCEGQYSGWLYGGSAVKAKTKSQIENVMKQIQYQKRAAEDMRESLALRMSAIGFNMPDVPDLPDEITRESMSRYSKVMRKYSSKIRAEAERVANPHFREIARGLKSRQSSGSVCPVCGEGDHGNRVDGKPYCYMIDKHKAKGVNGSVPLMTPEKAKDWKPPPKKSKPKSYTFMEPDGVVRK